MSKVKDIKANDNIDAGLQQKANTVFATHTVDVIYATADQMLFITRKHAELHAQNLNNNKILTIKKQETE